jgi:RHS repeat-associated protein
MFRFGRFIACVATSVLCAAALPQAAHAEQHSHAPGQPKVRIRPARHIDPPSLPSHGVARDEHLPRGKAAAKPRRVGELTGRRTPTTRVFKLSDGRLQAEVSAVPTSYRSGKRWKPIDTTVTPTNEPGYPLASKANLARAYFGTTSTRMVRYELDHGHWITMGLAGTPHGKHLTPKAHRGTVTYRNALPGADIAYTVQAGALKEAITLEKRPATAPRLRFTLHTHGLSAHRRHDGSIALFSESSGPRRPELVIPAPFMTDAKTDASSPYGKRASHHVAQTLTAGRTGDYRVTVRPDARWLASPKRRYPVVVDPTIEIQSATSQSEDVMITSDDPGTNFDSSWRLSVGTTSTGVARSLVRFPLTAIPAGTKLDSAQLRMYYDQTHTTGSNDVTLEAHRATGPWEETTATWNNANNLTGELSGTTTTVDDGDEGLTAAHGAWPASGNTAYTQYAINKDYLYNKDTTPGDTYTWQPNLPESGTYRVDVHYVPASDRATTAPFTVTYDGGSKAYTVDQSAGTGGVWKTLGSHPFQAGTAGKVVLGDTPASGSTAVIADAVRLVKDGTVVKQANVTSAWHSYPVTDTVQSWIDGTHPNYGFVLKAADETTLGKGGPRYEAAEYAYGGEVETYPKLILTYGRPGTTLDAPAVIHSTGAELHWASYTDPSTASGDDIVEYQVHRSIYQSFTPSAATLVAPVAAGTTSFTDTTATPTPADSPDPFGNAYYYMVAVKTRDGQVIPAPTKLVRLPKAGRTTAVYQGSATDTTLSSTQPTTGHDAIAESGINHPWLSVGDNSATYGKTRALLKFPTLTGIPTSARVLDAQMDLWGTTTTTTSSGAVYEAHALTRDFDETTATWNKATATTSWTTPGGDTDASVADTLGSVTNDPARRSWYITSLAQSWVTNPAGNHGVEIKLKDESATAPQERTIFLSSEADDPQLRPQLQVTYIDKTTDSTYYAPTTPARMIPGDTNTVDVTLTNTTTTVWKAADQVLSYRWSLPDGTDATTGGNQIQTPLPKDVVPGDTVTVHAQVKAPINSDAGSKRTNYTLAWDLYNKTAATWLSNTDAIPALTQSVAVEDPTSDALGLEKFYSYAGKNTGAGSTVMDNLASGNAVWSYNAFSNPGRGLGTFTRFAYNSLDTSDTVLGAGWSAQASGPLRLGAALDFHPNPNPTTVTLPDGDGTSHIFTKQSDGTWKAPAGVHYLLEQNTVDDCTPDKDNATDAWSMTRPDRTRLLFDCDGYLTSITDKNGNTETFTYESRKSNNKPVKFLRYITDPAARQTLTVDYWAKGEDYTYIDDTGAEVQDTNLTNPAIIDHVKSMTDISGRELTFLYSTKGLLSKLTDGAGSAQPKVFTFTYDATQGNKNVKLVQVTDPRGHSTDLTYNYPQTGDDPQFHWWAKTINDRLGNATDFTYLDPDGTSGSTIQTAVTDAENHTTSYTMDGFGRPTLTTNAKNQNTTLSWDADNNVTRLEEANGAVTTYSFDPKTGYPLTTKDAEANKNNTAAATYTYSTGNNGYIADLFQKKSPEGRTWQFGYDTVGNLTTVTDPDGTATTTAGDYTTTYTYDTYGELTKATDANGHATTYSDFEANGYPATTTDALTNASHATYDDRGQVLTATDELGKTTTQTYDTFGRPLVSKVPKDQSAGVYITTPAPVYDANDNVTTATAPNGAVTTAVFDDADELTSQTTPKDQPTDPDRIATYTYDKVGNQLTATAPKGNLPGATPGSYTTHYAYDELDRVISSTDAAGHITSTAYDEAGNTIKVVDPLKNLTSDTTDYTSTYAYDLNHQPVSVTDAAGHTKKTGYDKDGLQTSTTDEDGNQTLYTLDAAGQVTEVKAPHDDASGTITYDTTRYEYDQVGNTTKTYSPRAVAAGSTTAFTTQTVYDELNRVKKQLSPYDPNDSRYNTAPETDYTYDADSRLAKVSAPPSAGQSVRSDTTYTYWDDSQTKTTVDPWDITTAYDHDELGQQTSRTITSAGGSSSRTMSWTYYPNGMVHTRTDNGVPVGLQVELADNSDAQSTTVTGTWAHATTGSDHQGYDYQTHPAGSGSDSFTWNLTVPQDGTYQVYARYPSVTGAATTASYTIGYHGGTATKTVDQTKNSGTWVSLGSYAFTADDTTQKVTLAQNSGGTVAADAVKAVRDNSADTDNEKTAFTYSYDANGNLTDLADATPGARYDDYAATFDEVDQLSKLEVNKDGTAVHTTSFVYDADGNTASRTHDATVADFAYDTRNLLQKVTNKETATDTSPKVTQFTWTPGGQVDTETKANGNTVTSDYFLDGALKHQLEKKPNGTTVAEHTYTYDPDGNTTRDTSKVQNADDHAAYKNRTLDYTYTPRDQVAQVTKSDGTPNESYIYDDNGNVTSQSTGGQTTTSTYDRNRLATTTIAGITSGYHYDPFGRLGTVTTGSSVIERYTYDGFDHIASERKKNGTAYTTTNFTYDPFDRTVSQTQNAGATGEKTTVFDYLAMSNAVVSETENGKVTKTYQYSPWGERLSQVKTKSDGTKEPTYYTYDAHSNVQAVTDDNGDTKSTYGYTAYGSDDTSQDTGADKPGSTTNSPDDPYNAYRYNADRVDGSTGTYNMGFRTYDPGLNRFLTRDMYNGALDDMALAGDPLTGNRYAFAGGNPISNIELDGHGWLSDLGHAALDVAGMVPVVGAVADVANGCWYAAEGDYLDAGLSFAGAIPVIGDAAISARYAIKGAKYATEGIEAARALKNGAHVAEGVKDAVHGGEAAAGAAKSGKNASKAGEEAAQERAAQQAAARRQAAQRQAQRESQAEAGAERQGDQVAGCHSFLPNTKVLLADGHTKAIKNIKPGDKVKATNPTTGKTKSRTVERLITTRDDKDFATLTIHTPHHTGKLTATVTHPFWVPSKHTWLTAGHLKPGMPLRIPSGAAATVRSVRIWHHHHLTHDLTVEDLHTYYVLAGDTPVLVHNVDEGDLCKLTLGPSLRGQKAEGVAAERGDTVLAHEQRMINEFGDRNGCAACGATESGYKDGHWTGDHNPPNKLAPNGPWTLYPHCKVCSKQQGGIVRSLLKEYYDFPVWKP